VNIKLTILVISFLCVFTNSTVLADSIEQSSNNENTANKYQYEKFTIESNNQQLWLINNGQRINFEQLLKLPKFTLPKLDSIDKKEIDTSKLSSSRSIEILSIFGTYCSTRVIEIYSTGMRPYGGANIKVLDLNALGRSVRLTNFFSDSEIIQAFINTKDDVLQEAGKRVLDDSGKAKDITAFGLSKRFLNEFAIYDLDDEYVTVVFLIDSSGHGDGLDKDNFYTIKLKTPAKWKTSLMSAKQLKTGFLVSNRKEIKSLKPATQSLP
jgi:hypothetical protein